MKFTIPGKPISSNTAYPTGKDGRRHLSKDGLQFKSDVGWIAKQAMNGEAMFHWPIRITVECFFSDDAYEVKSRGLKRRNYHRDTDNCIKLLKDSMTGIVYERDSEIVCDEIWKDFSEEPRIEVEIEQL